MKDISRCIVAVLAWAQLAGAQRMMERLDRGMVAVRSGNGWFLSWRLLGDEGADVAFNIYRGGTRLNAAPLTAATSFLDAEAPAGSAYTVKAVVDGSEQAQASAALMLADGHLALSLQRPPGGTTPDGAYTYSPNDLGVGDLDGDGRYEIIVKWDPSDAKDNSQAGYTGNVFLDAYSLDGKRLWRIDLGRNIRAGAHYTQFLVYDFDGDGKAETVCKTAPGTRDASGNPLALGPAASANHQADYRNSDGYVLQGPEYLTVFGADGREKATADYLPARGTVSRWGDSYGNRVDRFLAGVAYLDGKRPSALLCRGYYNGQSGQGPGRTFIWAVDWRDGRLSQRWTFDTDASGNAAFIHQGAHSLTVGDVDGDGRDDLVYGAMAVGSDGKVLYNTRLCHGDALHMSDMLPSRPGLEVWMAHEDPGCYGNAGLEFRDARSGQLIFGVDGEDADVGRGVAGDIDPRHPGFEMWGSRGGLMSAGGTRISAARPGQMNFMAWWDGDLLREILDKEAIDKWDYAAGKTVRLLTASDRKAASNNGTKATPGLSADILGDWREEVIWRDSSDSRLLIFSSATPTNYRIPTLMHDPKYRLDVAWQNVGYNQPPHPGFFLGEGMAYPPPRPDIVFTGPSPLAPGKGGPRSRRYGPGPGAMQPSFHDLSGRRVPMGERPSLYVRKGENGGRILVPGL